MQPIAGAGSHFPKSDPPTPTRASAQFKENAAVTEIQTAVIGIVAGATGKFVADAIDANGNVVTDPTLLAGVTLTWTSDDTVNEPVVSSGTAGDLAASITVPATAPANATGATLSVSDGKNSGSVAVPVLPSTPPPPPPESIVGYVIRQTA